MYLANIGECIVSEVTLGKDEIAQFARACGDSNPLHHDEAVAAKSRFGGIIACGPQITSLLMGMVARHFSQRSASLDLEFNFRFRRAVLADEPLVLEWEVIAIEQKASLGGELVSLEGRVASRDNQELVTSTAVVLVTPKA